MKEENQKNIAYNESTADSAALLLSPQLVTPTCLPLLR
jgi:hypothetical protein